MRKIKLLTIILMLFGMVGCSTELVEPADNRLSNTGTRGFYQPENVQLFEYLCDRAFSWAIEPKYQMVDDAQYKKIVQAGADLITQYPPMKAIVEFLLSKGYKLNFYIDRSLPEFAPAMFRANFPSSPSHGIIFRSGGDINVEFLMEELLHACQYALYGLERMNIARRNIELEVKMMRDIMVTKYGFLTSDNTLHGTPGRDPQKYLSTYAFAVGELANRGTLQYWCIDKFNEFVVDWAQEAGESYDPYFSPELIKRFWISYNYN